MCKGSGRYINTMRWAARDSPAAGDGEAVLINRSLFSDLEPYIEDISEANYLPALQILGDHNQTQFHRGQYTELVKFSVLKDTAVKNAFEHYFYFFAR